METNTRLTSVQSSSNEKNPERGTQNVEPSSNMSHNNSTPSTTPSNGATNATNANNNNLNFQTTRFNPIPNSSINTPVNNASEQPPLAPMTTNNNFEIMNQGTPPYTATSNISTLPSVESVQAAISTIGANFNEEAIYAELTAQEDNRGYVRRPMNAFMVWSKQARRRIAMAYPNLLNCEISKLLGREWGRMTTAEKEPYVALSTKLRENHNLLHPDYTYKPRKRRRKGDAKSLQDFENAGTESQLFGMHKGFSLNNPLYNTNLSTFYTTTSSGSQHRYINPAFNHGPQIAGGQGPVGNNYGTYSSANIMKSMTNSNGPLGNIAMPPLNFQNPPSLLSYHQGSKYMQPNNQQNSGNVTNSHTSGGISNYGESMNTSQFYPSGTNFFSSITSTTPTRRNNSNSGNDMNNISNEMANNMTSDDMCNYLGNIDSTKIGTLLNIYGQSDEMNQSLTAGGGATPSGSNSNNMALGGQGQNIANIGVYGNSGGLFSTTNNPPNSNVIGGGNNNTGNPNQVQQQQLTTAMLTGNTNNFYSIQPPPLMQQYQYDNNANNENQPTGSNSRQRPNSSGGQ